MNICPQCDQPFVESQMTCPSCGSSSLYGISSFHSLSKTSVAHRITMVTLVLLIVTFLILLSGKIYFQEERQLDRIRTALASGDSQTILEVSHTPTEYDNLALTANDLQPLADYIKGQPDYPNQITSSNQTSGSALSIQKDGKYWGLFDRYRLVIWPVQLTVQVDHDEVIGQLAGQDIFLASPQNNYQGPSNRVWPGSHPLTLQLKGSDQAILVEENLLALDRVTSTELFNTNLLDFVVTSNILDGQVYIGDEGVGKLENGFAEIGPVHFDPKAQVSIRKTLPEGELISEGQTLSEEALHYSIDVPGQLDTWDIDFFLSELCASLTKSFDQEEWTDLYHFFESNSSWPGINQEIERLSQIKNDKQALNFQVSQLTIDQVKGDEYLIYFTILEHISFNDQHEENPQHFRARLVAGEEGIDILSDSYILIREMARREDNLKAN